MLNWLMKPAEHLMNIIKKNVLFAPHEQLSVRYLLRIFLCKIAYYSEINQTLQSN